MEPHYNAFISYRHHPEDIRVATQIHRLLERFQVPKALKKQNKGITKLFRDKDELPLTSDLSESIMTALKNSEFLIVICSVHTKESLWVQREIDAFLQTHSRSQVLTVLVNGEPYEVIPQTLLYEDTLDPATGAVTRKPLEPLSCDWRMPLGKARREELPRLAAALLHCSYDELRQRQKQYRMQKLLIGGSVALAASLALAVYFLYTSITIRDANLKIQENYTQALKNQSQYLSTAAQERMKDGDPLTALRLLTEALPGRENPRPYVAEAERVLTDALGVYSDEERILARGALIPDASAIVTDFLLTDDERYLYLLDNRNIVTVWNAESLLQEASIDTGMESCELLAVTASGNLLLQAYYGSGSSFTQCRQPDGALLWQQEGYMGDAAFLGDREILVGQISTAQGEDLLLFLDPATGAKVREPIPLTSEDGSSQTYSFAQQQFRADAPLILTYNADVNWKDYQTHVYLLDPDSADQQLLLVSKFSPDASCITEDGKVILMISDGSGQRNGRELNLLTTSPARSILYCFDQETGEALWQSEISTTQYSGTHTLLPVPGRDMLFCQAGNTFQLVSTSDGALQQYSEAPTAACQISQVTPEYAYGILKDGGICTYRFQENLCETEYADLPSNLRQAQIGDQLYTLPLHNAQVTVYSRTTPPVLWEAALTSPGLEEGSSAYIDHVQSIMSQVTELEAGMESASPEALLAQLEALILQVGTLSQGNAFLAENWLVMEGTEAIELYDLKTRSHAWTAPRSVYGSVLGFSPDAARLWTKEDLHTVASYDPVTGERQTYEIPSTMEEHHLRIIGDYFLFHDHIWYLLTQDQTLYLADFTPQTGALQYYPFLSSGVPVPRELRGCAGSRNTLELVLTQKEYSQEVQQQAYALMEVCDAFEAMAENARILSITEDSAWLLSGTGNRYVLPLTGEAPIWIGEGFTGPHPIAHRASDGITAIPGENRILLCSPEGQLLQALDLGSDRAGLLYFRGEELLCQTESGVLLRFDPEGTLLSRMEMLVSEEYYDALSAGGHMPSQVTWHETADGKLICCAYGAANILDCETWRRCAGLSCDFYYPGEDAFLRRKSGALEAIPRYSLEELLQIAREQLGEHQLTEEKKDAYGIG